VTAILVPVYNAPAATAQCLTRLREHVDASVQILVIDDASPDSRVAPMLQAAQRADARLRAMHNPANLGFVGTVNRGFRELADQDVLILNSDTLPTRGFLERLLACAASDARIASITPWSNNAEICSLPDFCRANPVPTDPDGVAVVCAQESDAGIDLPTGVGFCMWMRRAALREIGDFDDATFGRGYGEENDWCLRAAAHGWRNVLCASAYVAHVGHASFADTGAGPGGDNLRRLNARYPGYNSLVADFIARDPLAEARSRIVARLPGLSRATADLA
jgi:GT2 family glycosyltransferase